MADVHVMVGLGVEYQKFFDLIELHQQENMLIKRNQYTRLNEGQRCFMCDSMHENGTVITGD